MPASGLRSTTAMVLQKTDRFTREFVSIEDESNRYEPVENVPVTTYKSAEGQTPDSILIKVFRTVPDVVVVRDLVNAETRENDVRGNFRRENVRRHDSRQGLRRSNASRVGHEGAAQAVRQKRITAVLNQRLIRVLCDECKEAYTPNAASSTTTRHTNRTCASLLSPAARTRKSMPRL